MRKYLFFLPLFISLLASAKIPAPKKNTYVNDFAGVLSRTDIVKLNTKIHRIERLSGTQVAVVLIDKLPAEYDIEEFALLIGRKWHVGKNKDGLVYVASISQHKQRLEVAKNLTGKLTDEKCAEILNDIKPSFRNKDYSEGLNTLVNDVAEVLAPAPVKKQRPVPGTQNVAQTSSGKTDPFAETFSTVVAYLIFFGIPALVIWLIVRAFRRRRNTVYMQQPPMYNQGGNYPPGYVPPGGYPPGYAPGYGPGYGRSGVGSALGGFAAGAATGYIANELLKRHHHNDVNQGNYYPTDNGSTDYNSDSSSDSDSRNWGNWGGDSGSSFDSGSSSDSSSSSDSGFSGDSGATSDW